MSFPRDAMPAPVLSGAAATPGWVAAAPPIRIDALWRAWCIALLFYLLAMVWLMGFDGDFVIADRLYALQGGAWRLREHWFTVEWVHQGGKRLSWAMWLGVAMFTLFTWRKPAWRTWRRPLLMLLASVLLATSLVATIKHAVPMACPWNLQRYGGSGPYVALFEAWPVNLPRNACFPAAHASSGFAWIALYFCLLQVRPAWRKAGLALALAMGGIFALSQELRGAHFLSHDLTTIMLCWGVALVVFTVRRGSQHA